jgi:cellulose synthase/poly-beta-1,6-N-acetylglucosamine synthase-like glycosyltransferase
MNFYYCVSICLSMIYSGFVLRYVYFWKQMPTAPNPNDLYNPITAITVLIPVRNEADHILNCLKTILQNNYPQNLLEIIVLDDFSTDETPQIVQQVIDNQWFKNLRLLQLKNYPPPASPAFKKYAIQLGIEAANGHLMVTTDGDCRVPEKWLFHIAQFYETKSVKCIAAPVRFDTELNDFQRFQSLDFIGMMGVTGAGIQGQFTLMANGANFAYPKAVFHEVNGFEGITHQASGDDMLLMEKIAQLYPQEIGFLKNKNATVLTLPKPTIRAFLNQRMRWASKTSTYTRTETIVQLAISLLFALNIVVSGLLCFWKSSLFPIFGIQLLIKTLVDFYFLNTIATFFDRKDLISRFYKSEIYHILYIVIVGMAVQFKKKYEWKGRTTR